MNKNLYKPILGKDYDICEHPFEREFILINALEAVNMFFECNKIPNGFNPILKVVRRAIKSVSYIPRKKKRLTNA